MPHVLNTVQRIIRQQEQARDAEKRLDPFVFKNEAAYSPVSLK